MIDPCLHDEEVVTQSGAGSYCGGCGVPIPLSKTSRELAALQGLAIWLRSMDDPEDVLGRAARQTVTLTEIIRRANEALDA